MSNKIIHQAAIVFTIFCLLQTIPCSNKKEGKKSENSTLLSFFDENIPTCVHLEGDVMYGFEQPSEIDGFIDIDLVVNKEVLETLEADDNPCVVKYKLKI